MNYRHAYHAGSIADVFKHVVTIALLDRLKQKDGAFLALDTHAGTGLYDLATGEAGKTGEYRSGIDKLKDVTLVNPLVVKYRVLVESCNTPGSARFYPGSPLLIAKELRAQDRGIACELHDDDFPVLRHTLFPYKNISAHHRDGYEAMGAFLPPPEKRGLILIDPPFESPNEFSNLTTALRKVHARFAQGVYAIWYPIKERPALWRFHEGMIATGINKMLSIEFLTTDERDSRRLNGSGMLVVNSPYQLEDDLKPALEEIRTHLAPLGRVSFTTLTE